MISAERHKISSRPCLHWLPVAHTRTRAHTHAHAHTHTHTYLYTERERERERTHTGNIYIKICTIRNRFP